MKLGTAAALATSGQLRLLVGLGGAVRPFYRLGFLAAGVSSGLLARLAAGAVPLDRLAAGLAPEPRARDVLEAWLELGVRLGELRAGPRGYALRGRLARALADPTLGDAAAALVTEAAGLHHLAITEAPARASSGRWLTLADQRGDLVARSSRLFEPFVREAVDWAVPARGPVRLLEIGCGSGCYLRAAAARNRALEGLGLELQPEVAALASANLRAWGLADRIRVEPGDVRDRGPEARWDVVTLHNNIYYFPIEERVALLARVRGFLAPGGRLLVTTACRGGSAAVQILDLWGALTRGCGRLPGVAELAEQLRAAGFAKVARRRLIPGDAYFAFLAAPPAV